MNSDIRMEIFLALNLIKPVLMVRSRRLSQQEYGGFASLNEFVHFSFGKHF